MDRPLVLIPPVEVAWGCLPEVVVEQGRPLPLWARAIAVPLPRTTVAMLQLDWQHRGSAGVLDPELRGKLRYAAAETCACLDGQLTALADLRRIGLTENELEALQDADGRMSPDERRLISFARRMTRSSAMVDDDELTSLISRYGPRPVVAIVLLLAFANFQDRLLCSLGLDQTGETPLPPLELRIKSRNGLANGAPTNDHGVHKSEPTGEIGLSSQAAERVSHGIDRSRWMSRGGIGSLDFLPSQNLRNKPLRIIWSLVCLGYQPELARSWAACFKAFFAEAQDYVFEEPLCWLQTRALDSLY